MRTTKKGIVTIATVALGAAVAVWSLVDNRPPRVNAFVVPAEDIALAVGVDDAQAQKLVVVPNGHVVAGIIPHHLLVAPLVTANFAGMKNQPAPSTVVILGPDHPNAGRFSVMTTERSWIMDGGRVVTNTRVVNRLLSDRVASIDENILGNEHGVIVPIPFIHSMWPKASIVQIAIRGNATGEEMHQLAISLDAALGPNDVVFASVDFSHHKNASGAYDDDKISLPVIASGNTAAAMTIPVDSPPSIAAVMDYAARRKATEQVLHHTNAAEWTNNFTSPDITSYLTAYFTQS